MGSTYILHQSALTNTTSKNFISIYNPASSGKTVRVWRTWISNAQVSAITGGITILDIGGFSITYTAGTSITSSFVAMDSASTITSSGIIAETGATNITVTRLIRRISMATDEIAVSDATFDALNNIPGLSTYIDLGYNETDIQPFYLRETEGFTIQQAGSFISTATNTGTFDFTVEFDII